MIVQTPVASLIVELPGLVRLTKKFSFAEKPLAVYEGETTLKARLKANTTAQPGKHNLSAKLRVQACDDKVCYAPGALDLEVPVNIK